MVWVTNRARSPFDILLSATPMPQILALEMLSLLRRLVNAQQADWFACDSDPQWESQAEVSAGRWWPVPQHPRVNFEGHEHAHELKLHPDAVAWYSQWWAGGLDARAEEGEVALRQRRPLAAEEGERAEPRVAGDLGGGRVKVSGDDGASLAAAEGLALGGDARGEFERDGRVTVEDGHLLLL